MVLGGAIGLYVWNHNRHADWRGENTELVALKDELVARGLIPADDLALSARARANDARLASIQRVDAIPVITAGLGITAIGVGIWALIDGRDGNGWNVAISSSEVELRSQLTW